MSISREISGLILKCAPISNNLLKCLLAVNLTLLSPILVSCAIREATVHHGFSVGSLNRDKTITILDYQYGDQKAGRLTRPPRQDVESGRVSQATGTVGDFPIGEFVYIKWRTNADGKTHEAKVDLKNILPETMENKEIHVDFVNSDLRIFVISLREAHAKGDAACAAPGYEAFKCVQIY
jgi:hypothetical protein